MLVKLDLISILSFALIASGILFVCGSGEESMSFGNDFLVQTDEIVVTRDQFDSFEKRLLSIIDDNSVDGRNLKGYLVTKKKKCLKYYYW